MEREAKMANAPKFFLLTEEFNTAVGEVGINRVIADRMEQIVVDIVHIEPFELFLEYGLVIGVGTAVVFRCNVEAFARILFESRANENLGFAAMVNVGGVVVVNAALIEHVDYLGSFVKIDLAVL